MGNPVAKSGLAVQHYVCVFFMIVIFSLLKFKVYFFRCTTWEVRLLLPPQQ